MQIADHDNPLVGYTTDRELPAVHALVNLRLTLPRRLRIELLLYCTPTSKHVQQACPLPGNRATPSPSGGGLEVRVVGGR